jgi:hypothetical protein
VSAPAAPISVASALSLSPAQALALINSGWAPSVSVQSQLAIQSLMGGSFAASAGSEPAAVKAGVVVAAGVLTSTIVLAPFATVLLAFNSALPAISKFLSQFTIDLSGPNQTCSPVLWPSNFYYAKNPPTTASGTPVASLPPISPIAPGTLSALLIPPLCQAFADVGNCRLLDPTAMGGVAFMSNVWIASMVHAWNSGAIGFATDYFVPYIPSGPAVDNYWTGWGSGGVHTRDWNPWAWPPPFVIPGQGQYAFRPLSQVPASVADPSTEWQPGSGNPVGYPWSRIRANTPPFLNLVEQTIAGTAIVAGGIGIYAAVTRQSFGAVLKGMYSGATKWLTQ